MSTPREPTDGRVQPDGRPSWRFDRLVVIRRADLHPGEAPYWITERDVDGWLRGPFGAPAAAEMLAALGQLVAPGASSGGASGLLRTRLLDAVRRRELVAIAPMRPAASSEQGGKSPAAAAGGPAGKPPAADAKSAKREKTWVEFRLINSKRKPVAGARYRLKTPDGAVREGALDANGSVRVPGLDPGMCEITFLEYDGREWKRV